MLIEAANCSFKLKYFIYYNNAQDDSIQYILFYDVSIFLHSAIIKD